MSIVFKNKYLGKKFLKCKFLYYIFCSLEMYQIRVTGVKEQLCFHAKSLQSVTYTNHETEPKTPFRSTFRTLLFFLYWSCSFSNSRDGRIFFWCVSTLSFHRYRNLHCIYHDSSTSKGISAPSLSTLTHLLFPSLPIVYCHRNLFGYIGHS